MDHYLSGHITTDRIRWPEDNPHPVSVLRLDKIHPVVSGNKWFKLQPYIDAAKAAGKKTLLTFGGAYSNHIIATAFAAAQEGLASIGIIRGEEAATLSHTLVQARSLGMELFFISRDEYANRILPPVAGSRDYFLVPAGGYGPLGATGAAGITRYFSTTAFTHICCAVGTGTMIAGLINGCMGTGHPIPAITGISVMKNNAALENEVIQLLHQPHSPFALLHEYHGGGYARHKPALIDFMNSFYRQTGIPTDFVYTGKLFYAVHDLLRQGYFPAGSSVLVVHSGGLQGNKSLNKEMLIF